MRRTIPAMPRRIETLRGLGLALLTSFGLSHSLRADGLPLNEDGSISVPHTMLTLNDSQAEELEALQSVTLTKTQWAELRKVSPATPKRIVGILPSTWGDCLCFTPDGFGGILMKDGKLAILHDTISTDQLRDTLQQQRSHVLRVDSRGQFHREGVLIRFNTLQAAIEALPKVKEVEGEEVWRVRISAPPGKDDNAPIFDGRIQKVKAQFAQKGWKTDTYVYPLIYEPAKPAPSPLPSQGQQ